MKLEDDLRNMRDALDRAIDAAEAGVVHSTPSPMPHFTRARRRTALAALVAAAVAAGAVGIVTRLDSGGGNGGRIRTRNSTATSAHTVPSTIGPSTSTSTTPSTTTVPTSATTAPGVALQSVRWSSVVYPLAPHCAGLTPPVVVLRVAYPAPAPGVALAAVLVRCNSGAGTPPSALYLYDHATSASSPHLLAVLVSEADGWEALAAQASSPLVVNGPSISLAVAGFSSSSVPNCCPDVRTTLVWQWSGSGYRLTSSPPAHVTYPALR